jgi:ERCC4-type nuclease
MNVQQQELMDALFRKMVLNYGGKFTHLFRSDSAEEQASMIEEWKSNIAEECSRARLTRKQVVLATDALASRFPKDYPTAGEFLALCRAFAEPVVAIAGPRSHGSDRSRAAMAEIMSKLTSKLTGQSPEASHEQA